MDVAGVVYEVLEVLRGEAVLFVDEFHLLPRYQAGGGGARSALVDLEALARWLAKRADVRLRVVLTSSEGFAASDEALSRLHGYNVEFMVVRHMDWESFAALCGEYRGVRGCSVGCELVYGVAGGAPGYLPVLCQGMDAVRRFVERARVLLDRALSEAASTLATRYPREASGLNSRGIVELAYRLARGETVRPPESPLLYTLGQLLVERKILYPVWEGGGVRFKPQIPLYYRLLEAAVDKRTGSVLQVSVDEVLARISGAARS